MELGLKNKIAIVTGGSSGIGLAIARMLLQEGAKVAICARDTERLTSTATELRAAVKGAELIAQPCDVLNQAQVQILVAKIVEQWGGVDILINNAGRSRMTTFMETTDEMWREEFELKFFSIIYPVRAVYPHMKARGGGRILNMNAVLARQPEPHLVATSAARGGVLNLTKSLSTEFAPDNILVNAINLGTVVSGQWKRRYQQATTTLSEEEWLNQEAGRRNIPLGRFGQPEEVAGAVLFLVSAQASFITGATLDVGGGVGRYV